MDLYSIQIFFKVSLKTCSFLNIKQAYFFIVIFNILYSYYYWESYLSSIILSQEVPLITVHPSVAWHFTDSSLVAQKVGFPGGSHGKASARNAGDLGSIPGSGRSPGAGNGNPLQYSCLGNPTDGGTWLATVHEATKSRTRLSDFTHWIVILMGTVS